MANGKTQFERLRHVERQLRTEAGDCSQGAPRYPREMARWLEKQADELNAVVSELERLAAIERELVAARPDDK
jgi:hypothetical protein